VTTIDRGYPVLAVSFGGDVVEGFCPTFEL
jgi:hypothetical protein